MSGVRIEDLREARARRQAKAATNGAGRPAASDDDRPVVRLGVDLHRVVDEAERVLSADVDTYQRDGELVHVVRAAEPDPRRGVIAGTPQIRPLALASVRERLTRVATWEKYDARSDAYKPSLPSDAAVSALHARGSWAGVRPLVGVVETPCMRADGSILDVGGYDAATGLLYMPSCEVPSAPARPTQADAARALAVLAEPLAEFPFATEAARYVPIAAILTLLGRSAIAGATPMFVHDASTRGSGKSLLANVESAVTTGRSAPQMTYPPDPAELEKVLSSAALFGSRLIVLDNIAGTLGAAPLDKVLTADDRVALRVLGRSELRELAWRAVVGATGNNIVLGADTARRCLVCRLEPDVERPEDRAGWRHPDLLGHVRAHRGALVHAALVVLRAYVVADRPGAGSYTWGSYQPWAELIAGAIVFAGGANVLEARATVAGTPEPEVEALRTILAELPRLAPDGATARTIVSTLYPSERLRGETAPDGWDALRDALETFAPPRSPRDAPDVRRIGKALQGMRGRVVGGRRLVSAVGRARQQTWAVATVEGTR